MALEEFAGSIVLEIDGQEIDVVDMSVSGKTGRKLVKTMNRTGRAKGFSKGISELEISITVVIPVAGDLDWDGMQGAKLTCYPATPGGKRTSYLDCFSLEVGTKYSVESEARRDIKIQALREVKE